MENPEVIDKIKEVTAQIADLAKTRTDLQETLKSQCGFARGEKVKVFERIDAKRIERGFGYIRTISVNSHGDITFALFKEKKDGTQSAALFSKNDQYVVEKI